MARAGVTASIPVEYVGSVTKSVERFTDFDTPEKSLDVLSVAEVGDLVVLAMSSDTGSDTSFSWEGMAFSAAYNQMNYTNPNRYVGYLVVGEGDANPYVSGFATNFFGSRFLSIVASVFRYAKTPTGNEIAWAGSGMPSPPSLSANGRLWVITGHLDDDQVIDWAAPSNYTLGASEISAGNPGAGASSTAIAYRIENLNSDDPGAFTGSGTDGWAATTLAFN